MGAEQSHGPVAVPLERTNTVDTTHIFRAATHPNELITTLVGDDAENCWDLFMSGCRAKGDGNFLGSRKKNPDGTFGEYVWISYRQAEEMALSIGAGLINAGCAPTLKFPDEEIAQCKEMKLIGVFTKNREEWFILEQAVNAYGLVLVPLYDTLGLAALEYILTACRLPTVVVSSECLKILEPLLSKVHESLKNIVSLDPVSEETRVSIEAHGVKLFMWNDLLAEGSEHPQPINPGGPDDCCTICYTSGTTGNPKGVVQTHRNFTSVVSAAVRGQLSDREVNVSLTDMHMSYLPLAHVLERVICNVCIALGASIAVYSGDTFKLLDDMQHAKPTIFVSVPRLFNRINDRIFAGIQEKSNMRVYLFNKALEAKLRSLRKTGKTAHTFYDRLIFNKTKALMGGEVRFMIVGGAPLAAAIQERIAVLFCCPVLEGYGMTESMGGSFVNIPKYATKGHVGGVIASVEFMLHSVPEMGYYATDSPPKGELCMRGPAVTPGYFQAPEQTKESFDEEGWLHSGDVAMLLPNGAVQIIDRAKNMFKLAQGEYVAPEKIEQVYQQASLVSQIFVFGYSDQPWLIAIVVPDAEMAKRWAEKSGYSFESLQGTCGQEEFITAVDEDMEEAAIRMELKGFEKVKKIHLTANAFTVEDQLMTPTQKLRRNNLKSAFQREIDAMYGI